MATSEVPGDRHAAARISTGAWCGASPRSHWRCGADARRAPSEAGGIIAAAARAVTRGWRPRPTRSARGRSPGPHVASTIVLRARHRRRGPGEAGEVTAIEVTAIEVEGRSGRRAAFGLVGDGAGRQADPFSIEPVGVLPRPRSSPRRGASPSELALTCTAAHCLRIQLCAVEAPGTPEHAHHRKLSGSAATAWRIFGRYPATPAASSTGAADPDSAGPAAAGSAAGRATPRHRPAGDLGLNPGAVHAAAARAPPVIRGRTKPDRLGPSPIPMGSPPTRIHGHVGKSGVRSGRPIPLLHMYRLSQIR
jgi:hypothetical protein